MYQGIENHTALMRDTSSKGLVNVDNESLLAYKKQRSIGREQKSELLSLQQDLNDVRSEMTEIKEMLAALLNR
jgi:hypothetical protein